MKKHSENFRIPHRGDEHQITTALYTYVVEPKRLVNSNVFKLKWTWDRMMDALTDANTRRKFVNVSNCAEPSRDYTLWITKHPRNLFIILSHKLTDFQNSFTFGLLKNRPIVYSLVVAKFAPHLKCVSTLSCEILMLKIITELVLTI